MESLRRQVEALEREKGRLMNVLNYISDPAMWPCISERGILEALSYRAEQALKGEEAPYSPKSHDFSIGPAWNERSCMLCGETEEKHIPEAPKQDEEVRLLKEFYRVTSNWHGPKCICNPCILIQQIDRLRAGEKRL